MMRLEPLEVFPLVCSSGEVTCRGEGEEESHSSSHSFFFPRENARVSEPWGEKMRFSGVFPVSVFLNTMLKQALIVFRHMQEWERSWGIVCSMTNKAYFEVLPTPKSNQTAGNILLPINLPSNFFLFSSGGRSVKDSRCQYQRNPNNFRCTYCGAGAYEISRFPG